MSMPYRWTKFVWSRILFVCAMTRYLRLKGKQISSLKSNSYGGMTVDRNTDRIDPLLTSLLSSLCLMSAGISVVSAL